MARLVRAFYGVAQDLPDLVAAKMKTLIPGTRVRVNKRVMIIGGRLAVIARATHPVTGRGAFHEGRLVAVRLIRPMAGYPNHRKEAWLIDRSMVTAVAGKK